LVWPGYGEAREEDKREEWGKIGGIGKKEVGPMERA
jgi:hypothetical protein